MWPSNTLMKGLEGYLCLFSLHVHCAYTAISTSWPGLKSLCLGSPNHCATVKLYSELQPETLPESCGFAWIDSNAQ